MRLSRALVLATALLAGTPALAAGGDPLRPRQWALDMVEADKAWRAGTGEGVVVAVIGTGVDLGHPDLRTQIAPGGYDFISPNQPPQDDAGGGTTAAGIVAARRGNRVGTVGVAPDARILPIRVSDDPTQWGPHFPGIEETSERELIGRGIRYAADHGARVILVATHIAVYDPVLDAAFGSLTPTGYDFRADVDYAWSKGAVVVVPGGDHAVSHVGCPYAATKAICVAAVDSRGNHAWYSRHHQAGTVVCAPGGSSAGLYLDDFTNGSSTGATTKEDVLVPVARGSGKSEEGYFSTSGTYVAAAHVAGVAALLAGKRLPPAEIVRRIVTTATDVAPAGEDPFCGNGLVKAAKAMGVS